MKTLDDLKSGKFKHIYIFLFFGELMSYVCRSSLTPHVVYDRFIFLTLMSAQTSMCREGGGREGMLGMVYSRDGFILSMPLTSYARWLKPSN